MQNVTIGKAEFRALDAQEEMFVNEYLVDFNALRAARAAGYSKACSNTRSASWTRLDGPKPHVGRAIRTAMQNRANRLNVTTDAVISELAKIGFSNMMNYINFDDRGVPFFDLTNLNHTTAAAIKSLVIEEFVEGRGENKREIRKVKLELYDKKAALVNLGQHLGIFGKVAGGGNAPGTPDDSGAGDHGSNTVNNFNITLIPAGHHYQDGALIEGEIVGNGG